MVWKSDYFLQECQEYENQLLHSHRIQCFSKNDLLLRGVHFLLGMEGNNKPHRPAETFNMDLRNCQMVFPSIVHDFLTFILPDEGSFLGQLRKRSEVLCDDQFDFP